MIIFAYKFTFNYLKVMKNLLKISMLSIGIATQVQGQASISSPSQNEVVNSSSLYVSANYVSNTEYRVKIAMSNGNATDFAISGNGDFTPSSNVVFETNIGTQNSYTVSNLERGRSYSLIVKTYNRGNGTVIFSNRRYFTTSCAAPSITTFDNLIVEKPNSYFLSWNSVINATTYRVRIANSGTSFNSVDGFSSYISEFTTSSTSSSIDISSLNSGYYTIAIKAGNSIVGGEWSRINFEVKEKPMIIPDFINVSNDFFVDATTTSANFEIQSNISYSISSSASWLRPSMSSAFGNLSISFEMDANATFTDRSATLSVYSSDLNIVKYLIIRQNAAVRICNKSLNVSSTNFYNFLNYSSNIITSQILLNAVSRIYPQESVKSQYLFYEPVLVLTNTGVCHGITQSLNFFQRGSIPAISNTVFESNYSDLIPLIVEQQILGYERQSSNNLDSIRRKLLNRINRNQMTTFVFWWRDALQNNSGHAVNVIGFEDSCSTITLKVKDPNSFRLDLKLKINSDGSYEYYSDQWNICPNCSLIGTSMAAYSTDYAITKAEAMVLKSGRLENQNNFQFWKGDINSTNNVPIQTKLAPSGSSNLNILVFDELNVNITKPVFVFLKGNIAFTISQSGDNLRISTNELGDIVFTSTGVNTLQINEISNESTTFKTVFLNSTTNYVVANTIISSVSIYPNPSTGEFKVSNAKSVSVFDIFGKAILTTSETTFTISSKGIFIAKVETENGVKFVKLIVE